MEQIDLSKEGFRVTYEIGDAKYYASVNPEFRMSNNTLLPTGKMIVVLLHSTGTKIFTLELGDNNYWISKDAPVEVDEAIINKISDKICSKYM